MSAELGDVNRASPLRCSPSSASLPQPSNTVQYRMLYSTGSNSDGQLANGSTVDSCRFAPTTGSLPTAGGRIIDMAFGASHTVVLVVYEHADSTAPRNLNGLYACGSNKRGQLGPGFPSDPPTTELRRLNLHAEGVCDLPAGSWEPVAVACCWETSLVVMRSTSDAAACDQVLVLGATDWGERAGAPSGGLIDLSSAAPAVTGAVRVMKVSAGPRHVLALIDYVDNFEGLGSVKRRLVGWGAARHGQLGCLGGAPGQARTQTVKLSARVDKPTMIDLGHEMSGGGVVEVAVGRDHTVLLVDSAAMPTPRTGTARQDGARPSHRANRIVCLGANKSFQRGAIETSALSPNEIRVPLPVSDAGANQNEQNDRDGAPQLTYQIQAGWSTTYLLSSSATSQALHAFGSNAHSQLGLPSTTCSSSALPVPINLPPPPPGQRRSLVQLAGGSEHVLLHCRTRDEGAAEGEGEGEDEVWAWGWNEHGNLGTGDQLDGERPVRVWPVEGDQGAERVVGVWAGNATSWIATASSGPSLSRAAQ